MEPDEGAESVPMQAFIAERFEETFVEIYAELEERVLVTCIEVLSPSNKRPGTEGWIQYERKRRPCCLGTPISLRSTCSVTAQDMPC